MYSIKMTINPVSQFFIYINSHLFFSQKTFSPWYTHFYVKETTHTYVCNISLTFDIIHILSMPFLLNSEKKVLKRHQQCFQVIKKCLVKKCNIQTRELYDQPATFTNRKSFSSKGEKNKRTERLLNCKFIILSKWIIREFISLSIHDISWKQISLSQNSVNS